VIQVTAPNEGYYLVLSYVAPFFTAILISKRYLDICISFITID